jgi:hypothetical protein
MKMHLTDGEIRALLDHESGALEKEKAEQHLGECSQCRTQAEIVAARARQTGAHLAVLAPQSGEAPSPANLARARLDSRIIDMEGKTMLKKIFARQYRLAWVAVAIIAILAVALAFPPVQAIANSFLGLFRVQQVTLVQVNPGNLPDQLGSSSQFEYMLSEDVQFEETGEPQQVVDAAGASALAGIPVRLPASIEGDLRLEVQPGTRATFKVDLARVRAVLAELGQDDIQLPDELDGATVTLDLPASAVAAYGDCQFDSEAARAAGSDPDAPTPRLPECTTLVQMISPTITAPPGLDLAKLGEAFLQVMGMSPEEAANFSQTVDWTTTLVVPIPRYGTDYKEVQVDGVQGWFIQQSLDDHADQYLLMWIKDEIVYALTGPGNIDTALTIAESLK